MDKEFDECAREFDESFKKSEAYKNLISKGYDQNAKDLLGWYIQYKQQKSNERVIYWTRWLVFGTWILAIGTLLVLIFK